MPAAPLRSALSFKMILALQLGFSPDVPSKLAAAFRESTGNLESHDARDGPAEYVALGAINMI